MGLVQPGQLTAALMGQAKAMPAFTGAEPFFHAEYGTSKGRVYDSADIYGKLRPGTGMDNLKSAKTKRGGAKDAEKDAEGK